MSGQGDEAAMRAVALQNAQSILQARQRAEEQLLQAKRELAHKSEQLAASLASMRATLESTTDAILAVDAGARITAFNRRFVELFALAPEAMEDADHARLAALLGTRLRDPEAYLARLGEIEASAAADSFDELELADGRVLERFSQVQHAGAEGHGRVWSFRDISKRRRAETALREESRALELLNRTGAMLASKLDVAELLQAVTDTATEISGASFGAFFYNTVEAGEEGEERLMRYTLSGAAREVFERFGAPRPTALFGPTLSGAALIRCDDVLADPRYGLMAPHKGMPKGHPAVRSYLAVPVISRSGEVLGALFFGHPEPAVFSERTEQLVVAVAAQAAVAIDNARLYEAARHAAAERERLLASERALRSEAERMSALKDEFLATLSHELRTPLGAILGWAQILRRGRRGPADIDKGLGIIERNARVQAQLIEDLLDMSRISSGKVRLEAQPVDPCGPIEAALETVRPAAEARGITLAAELDPGAGLVSGDPDRLQQIVWNLLSNAIKFTPRAGRVLVRLARVDDQLEIGVADTGSGIDPAFLGHVFERFRQADGSTTRSYGGLGLGLSIVKSLAELHGGTVRAESPGAGCGATFTVCLPLAAAGVTAPPAPAPTLARPDLSGLTVLAVDDEPDTLALLVRLLEDCGARVLCAASAPEALALHAHGRPDLLISDIGMPMVDGYELIRRVRELGAAAGGALPAIALTAFARAEDRRKALKDGYQAFLTKPVEHGELVALVAQLARPGAGQGA
ncbi:MAG: ATP-binding protein [Pseudomonadota bacterium]